ncbi:MAG: hypothetical protein ACK47R_18205, partial [Planctomycetia bacterium]
VLPKKGAKPTADFLLKHTTSNLWESPGCAHTQRNSKAATKQKIDKKPNASHQFDISHAINTRRVAKKIVESAK